MHPTQNERGITLVMAVLFVLMFLGLTVSLSFNSRSETQMSNGIKLQQYYTMAGESVISRTRSNFDDYWVTVDPYFADNDIKQKDWRLGSPTLGGLPGGTRRIRRPGGHRCLEQST